MDDLLTAVFQVITSRDGSEQNLCVMQYVRLMGNITRGAALPKITENVKRQYKTSEVSFKFWCEGWSASGPTAEEIS